MIAGESRNVAECRVRSVPTQPQKTDPGRENKKGVSLVSLRDNTFPLPLRSLLSINDEEFHSVLGERAMGVGMIRHKVAHSLF